MPDADRGRVGHKRACWVSVLVAGDNKAGDNRPHALVPPPPPITTVTKLEKSSLPSTIHSATSDTGAQGVRERGGELRGTGSDTSSILNENL
jgi:hypothetical protein